MARLVHTGPSSAIELDSPTHKRYPCVTKNLIDTFAPRGFDRSVYLYSWIYDDIAKTVSLLSTAERLFYERGFHATGVDCIVAEAGVVRMTLLTGYGRRRRDTSPGRGTQPMEPGLQPARVHPKQGDVGIEEENAEIHNQALQAKKDLMYRIQSALVRDDLPGQEALARRIFLILEGNNAALPALGVEAVLADARTVVEELIRITRFRTP